MRRARSLLLALLLAPAALPGQSVLERSPNVQGVWGLAPGSAAFVFAHRFELLNGGDEMFNVPTLTLAAGLPLGLTLGLDFSSNSEIVQDKLAGNETEYWIKRPLRLGRSTALAGLVGYNTAAESWDGALSARQELGPVALFGEVRGYSDRFGTGEAGVAGTLGGAVRLTPHLAVTGDIGRMLDADSLDAVWSGGVAIGIPGTPHTFSLQATNGGAITLQGVSREKVLGTEDKVRYGFVFTVPLGTGSQWGRIFRPAPAAPPAPPAAAADTIAARVEMKMIAFLPQEVRIRPGQSVEWINLDPVVHTATADDGSWGSELLQEGQRYVRRFDRAGRYPYHCVPHPQMTGVVIVEEP